MICFYYNVCDCLAFIKGNLLTYFSLIFILQGLLKQERIKDCSEWVAALALVTGRAFSYTKMFSFKLITDIAKSAHVAQCYIWH